MRVGVPCSRRALGQKVALQCMAPTVLAANTISSNMKYDMKLATTVGGKCIMLSYCSIQLKFCVHFSLILDSMVELSI